MSYLEDYGLMAEDGTLVQEPLLQARQRIQEVMDMLAQPDEPYHLLADRAAEFLETIADE